MLMRGEGGLLLRGPGGLLARERACCCTTLTCYPPTLAEDFEGVTIDGLEMTYYPQPGLPAPPFAVACEMAWNTYYPAPPLFIGRPLVEGWYYEDAGRQIWFGNTDDPTSFPSAYAVVYSNLSEGGGCIETNGTSGYCSDVIPGPWTAVIGGAAGTHVIQVR